MAWWVESLSQAEKEAQFGRSALWASCLQRLSAPERPPMNLGENCMLVAKTRRSRAQVASQPSSGARLPSSHSSPGPWSPSPQTGAGAVVAVVEGSAVVPGAVVVLVPSVPVPVCEPEAAPPVMVEVSPVEVSPVEVVPDASPEVVLSAWSQG